MSLLNSKKEKVEKNIFRDVILLKEKLGIKTYKICIDLDLEEELVSDYFSGKTKDNLFLGLELLNYLEKKEKNDWGILWIKIRLY